MCGIVLLDARCLAAQYLSTTVRTTEAQLRMTTAIYITQAVHFSPEIARLMTAVEIIWQSQTETSQSDWNETFQTMWHP